MTDVIMPEMNGLNLAEEILSHCPGIGPLFMSGYTSDFIAHHGILEKRINSIQKPLSLQGLATKVRELLEKE